MKALLIGDVHLSSIPPSARTESYAQDILDKLEWIVDFANRSIVDVVVQLGDLWHSKVPNKTPHWLVQKTAKIFEQSSAPVFVVPGNHDMRHDRLDSLVSQPLGTLAISPNVDILEGWNRWKGLYGIPYTEDLDRFQDELMWASRSPGVDLIVVHAAIFPPGVHPPYPHWNANDLETHGIPIAYGHIHEPHGSYQAGARHTWFCNNGAISRGSLHEETVNREITVTMFDSARPDNPFTAIPVPYRPASEVFKLAEHKVEQDRIARLDNFLYRVRGVSLAALSVEEVVNHVETSNLLDAPAVHEMKEIIETVS